MTRLGVDYSVSRPGAAALKAAGYTFACRYLAAGSAKNAAKALTKAEADQLRAGGIDLVSNWEVATNAALKGRAQGIADAKAAAAKHVAAGGPVTRPIYFSVDFDATEAQQTAINAYFDGVISVIGLARAGAYGGYWVVSRLFDAGKIRWGWQTYAWSGGHWDTRAQLRQVKNGITVNGADCDRNEAHADDFGQWGYVTTMEDEMAITDAQAYNAQNTPLCIAEMLPTVGVMAEDKTTKGVENKLTTTLNAIKEAVTAPTPVTVDATAVATALAGSQDFLKALAKAVNDDAAARLAG